MDELMTAKEYLSQAYRIDQRINAKLMQIQHLRSLSQRCTVAFGGERVSSTRNVSSMEDVIIKIMDAETELDAQIDRFVDLKAEIQKTIDRLPDQDCRLLLELRYLAMDGWLDIAGKMNLCRAHVNRLHNKALKMVADVLGTRSE